MRKVIWGLGILLIGLPAQAAGPVERTDDPQPSTPVVQQILPQGWMAGEVVEVQVLGSYLDQAREVRFEVPGLKGSVIRSSLTSATLRISSEASAEPGLYGLSLVTARGWSNRFHFRLTRWKSVLEAEPNDRPAQAQPLAPGATVNGMIRDINDSDFYRLHAQQGEVLAFNVLMGRNGYSTGGPVGNVTLTLLNAAGQAVASNYSQFIWDPYFQHRFDTPGEYFLVVDHSRLAVTCNQGCENQRLDEVYQVSIGRSPVLWSLWPPAARPGTTVEALLAADFITAETPLLFSGSGVRGQITGRAESDPGRYEVKIEVDGDAQPGPRYLTVPDDSGNLFPLPFLVPGGDFVIEREPNDTLEQSSAVTLPKFVLGRINHPRDVDSFLFQANEGDPLAFQVDARKLGSAMLDPHLALLAANGDIIALNDDRPSFSNPKNRDSKLDVLIPFAPNCAKRSDRFFIQVRDTSKHAGDALFYLLTLRKQAPSFELGSSSGRLFLQRGGKANLPVSLRRLEGFQDEVTVAVSGLPPGVTAKPLTIKSTESSGNLELTASDDALETSLAIEATGTARIGGKDVIKPLVLPQARLGDGLAYVPADANFLTLHVVPAVQFGIGPFSDGRDNRVRISLSGSRTAELLLKIERRKGFAAPLDLAVEGLPEGVVLEQQHFSDEGRLAHLQVRALEDARLALGEYRIAAAAVAEIGGRKIQEGTATLTLRIEE